MFVRKYTYLKTKVYCYVSFKFVHTPKVITNSDDKIHNLRDLLTAGT